MHYTFFYFVTFPFSDYCITVIFFCMQFDKKNYCPKNIKIYKLSLNIEIAKFTFEWPYSTIMTMLLSNPFVECMNFAPLTISLHDSRLRYARLSSCKEIVRGAIFMHSPKGSDNNTLCGRLVDHPDLSRSSRSPDTTSLSQRSFSSSNEREA